MTLLLVVVGAAVGAPLRYLTDRWVQSRYRSAFPWGTFVVNMTGSFLLGALAAGSLDGRWAALLGIGFCGALTTYSTFGYETVRLVEDGAYVHALANVTASIAVGLGAAFGGAALVSAVS